MTEERPQQIGRYEVITRLAIGGMAELFLARERGIAGLERLVVLKRILPHLADNPSFIDMFLREARIVARLAHPNVVQIFDLGEEDGTFYIAMEYIHGSTVRELQVLSGQEGRFPLDVATGVVIQALRGLHAAHELKDLDGKPLGLVHRDVSPHNLMCTVEGHVKLLDFGVAKATEEGLEATYSGNLKGKFAYMSPEQARRQPLDRRSDVFGMGIVVWEMLTGERLFKRDNEMDMMQAVLAGEIPSITQFNAEVPREIDDIVQRALRRDRDERWSSADEMRQKLSSVATEHGIDTSEDRVSQYVKETAGPQLQLRRKTLQNALERSLTSFERDGLLHATGSESGSVDTEVDIPLALKMTRQAIEQSNSSSGSSAEADDPAGTTGETVISPTRDIEETAAEDSKSGRATLFLAIPVVVLLLAATAFVASSMLAEDTEEADKPVLLGEPLPIAWSPTVEPDLLRKEIEPLQDYLERATGRPIPIQITRSYGDSSRMLIDGEVAFAVLPPLMYVRTRARSPQVDPIAIKLFDGATQSDALLLVRGDSDVRNLEDLRGGTFCFTDKNSTSGHFLPRAYLRREGYDLEQFVGKIHWTGDHITSLRKLLDGTCDVAATYSGAFISADKLEDINVGRLRTIAITGNIPQDAVVAGPAVKPSDKRAMQEALLAFDSKKHLDRERLGETQRITTFEPVKDSRYDSLRELINEFKAPDEPDEDGEADGDDVGQ
jgi:phosphate/phosphite/phosphonate ABC transporter binding protein